MSGTKNLSMLFGGNYSEEFEDIVIYQASGNAGRPASVTLPSGKWSDGLELIICGGFTTSGQAVNSVILNEWEIKQAAWQLRVRFSDETTPHGVTVARASDTTANLFYESAVSAVKSIILRRKKYTTTNLSVVIPVNNGNNIAVNARYEIPASALPASFLNVDGTIKNNVLVRAEIFNNSGAGVAAWFESKKGEIFNTTTNTLISWGVDAQCVGDKIYIASGGYGSLHTGVKIDVLANGSTQNLLGIQTINAAPCRAVAVLAGEAYTVQTA